MCLYPSHPQLSSQPSLNLGRVYEHFLGLTLTLITLQVNPHTLPNLGSLRNLRSLNLSSNGITELTNGLSALSNITSLVLDGNKLSQNAISKITLIPHLHRLDLASNGLTCFKVPNLKSNPNRLICFKGRARRPPLMLLSLIMYPHDI